MANDSKVAVMTASERAMGRLTDSSMVTSAAST